MDSTIDNERDAFCSDQVQVRSFLSDARQTLGELSYHMAKEKELKRSIQRISNTINEIMVYHGLSKVKMDALGGGLTATWELGKGLIVDLKLEELIDLQNFSYNSDNFKIKDTK